jgi:hypothetical protein
MFNYLIIEIKIKNEKNREHPKGRVVRRRTRGWPPQPKGGAGGAMGVGWGLLPRLGGPPPALIYPYIKEPLGLPFSFISLSSLSLSSPKMCSQVWNMHKVEYYPPYTAVLLLDSVQIFFYRCFVGPETGRHHKPCMCKTAEAFEVDRFIARTSSRS